MSYSVDDKVCVLKTESYAAALMDERMAQLFDLCGFNELIRPDMKVLIKPNLLIKRHPDAATTTHPELVAAVIRRLKALGVSNILIADSGGGEYTVSSLKALYSGTGMAAAADENGAMLNFDISSRPVPYLDGHRCKQFDIIAPVLHSDLIINICKLKTHMMADFSACVKNMFGSVPGLLKPELHCRFPEKSIFCEMLVDLCLFTAPAINIVDGVLAMEGNGPSGGYPRWAKVLIASKNPFSADIAAAAIANLEPEDILYLKDGISRGICPAGIPELPLCGDDIAPLIISDFKHAEVGSVDFVEKLPKFMRRTVSAIITPKPVINKKGCIGCMKCGESCPQHTIEKIDGKAVIEYSECINCFCCHEMCPVKAIGLKRSSLWKILSGFSGWFFGRDKVKSKG